jgi:hypothetical protein
MISCKNIPILQKNTPRNKPIQTGKIPLH